MSETEQLSLIAVSCLANDHGLMTVHPRAYASYGRWVLAAAILVGWSITAIARPHVIVIAALLGLLAGSIILNVIKEELPEKRPARFSFFVVGAFAYAGVLLALRYLD